MCDQTQTQRGARRGDQDQTASLAKYPLARRRMDACFSQIPPAPRRGGSPSQPRKVRTTHEAGLTQKAAPDRGVRERHGRSRPGVLGNMEVKVLKKTPEA